MEQDTEEAFEKHRELVKLLVEKIALSRNEEGRTNVDSPTDSGRLPPQWGEQSADGVKNSLRLGKAHPGRQTRSSREGTRA